MPLEIIVPALTIRDAYGNIDWPATSIYAERAARTWIDRFIISGSNTRGDLCSPAERAKLLDLWLEIAGPERLLACAWQSDDVINASVRRTAVIAVMQAHATVSDTVAQMHTLPPESYLYSHPLYTQSRLDAHACVTLIRAGVLPAGAKIAKVGAQDISAIRAACGAAFRLWDGSCRNIQASIEAGATQCRFLRVTVV